MRHVPALDGLRGLAIVGVLLFHAKGALPGGYLGVDLFFVLSGYLITSLLLREHRETGRIDLSRFWVRRARRLFPALLSLMPAIALYGAYLAKPADLHALRGDALATLAYVANWRSIFSERSYWELFASPSPLEHTWSLCIEEQFYVVWPLVLWAVLKRLPARAVLGIAVGLALVSALAMWFLFDEESPSRVYLGTDTRATGILLGAALATVLSPDTEISPKTSRRLDWLGLAVAPLMALAWWKLRGTDPFLYRGGFWLTELGALALIACSLGGNASFVAKALSWSPLRFLGTISYGVYLWHWPVDVVLTEQRIHAGRALPLVQLAVTFAIALASYRFLESPIRQRGIWFGRPAVVVPTAIALAALFVVRGTHARPIPPAPSPPPEPPPAQHSGAATPEPPPFKIMMLGDSTANSFGWGLRGLHRPGVSVELEGEDGCKLLTDSCGGPEWAAKTAKLRPQATLLYVGGAFLYGVRVKGKWTKSCHAEWDDKFEQNLRLRLGDLRSPGTRVWVMTVPYPLGPYDDDDYRAQVDCINRSIRKSVAEVPGISILDFGARFCPEGVCVREHEGVEIRPDGVHYSIDGIAPLASWVLEQIRD